MFFSSNKYGKEIPGEIHVKLQQTTATVICNENNQLQKRIGVEDFIPLMVVGKGTFAKVTTKLNLQFTKGGYDGSKTRHCTSLRHEDY